MPGRRRSKEERDAAWREFNLKINERARAEAMQEAYALAVEHDQEVEIWFGPVDGYGGVGPTPIWYAAETRNKTGEELDRAYAVRSATGWYFSHTVNKKIKRGNR